MEREQSFRTGYGDMMWMALKTSHNMTEMERFIDARKDVVTFMTATTETSFK